MKKKTNIRRKASGNSFGEGIKRMILNNTYLGSNTNSIDFGLRGMLAVFIITLFSTTLQAQEEEKRKKAIFLRGKAMSTGVMEDIYFLNWNIGVEYRFAEKHSLGVDVVNFRWRFEEDIYLNGAEQTYGPDIFSRRRYLLADYRFYPTFSIIQNKYIEPYVNPFIKVGERKIWTNDASTFYSEKDLPTVKEHRADFTDYGMALGVRFGFGDKGRVGLDVNVGMVYRETRVQYEQRYDYQTDSFSDHYFRTYHNWHPHMRLNLYVRIFNLK